MALIFERETARQSYINDEDIADILGWKKGSVLSYKSTKSFCAKLNAYILKDDVSKEELKKILSSSPSPIDEVWSLFTTTQRNDYYISSYGRAKGISKRTSKETFLIPYYTTLRKVSPGNDRITYYRVSEKADGVLKENFYPIANLVAEAFISKDTENSYVIHKNGIRDYNVASNLKWGCRSEFFQICRQSCLIPVVKIDKSTGYAIKEYPGIRVAAEDVGASPSNISAVANGKYKTAKGFIWRYSKDIVDTFGTEDFFGIKIADPVVINGSDHSVVCIHRDCSYYLYDSVEDASNKEGVSCETIRWMLNKAKNFSSKSDRFFVIQSRFDEDYMTSKEFCSRNMPKSVVKIDNNGKIINTYRDMEDAAKHEFYSVAAVRKFCNDKNLSTEDGSKFMFHKDYINELEEKKC